ncbi:MAG: BTAD domain-containing putative transcriptional regulator [Pseudomonadota bacterium]
MHKSDNPSEQPVKYAKLARPRLFEALPRARLFGLLDAVRAEARVVWITSPPGAGKTTLAASYLSHTGAAQFWCQIDAGDADASTLFFFLSETVRDAGPRLPWLTPDLASDLPRFQRMFLRDFYSKLPQGAVVVLDNVHEFDWDNAGELMELALAEVPEGIHVFALSREAPPARLARMQMGGRLALLGWNDLRFDDAEARALAQQGGEADPIDRDWLARVDGWAAGVVMLRSLKQQPGQAAPAPLEGRDALFRYFAGEILERMPKSSQRLLLLLSALPGTSAADAEQLTGESAAAGLLEQLYHKRLFVERRGGGEPTYHFHALFREFLEHEARQRLAPHERAGFIARAAAVLERQGQGEVAAQLYQQAGAYPELAKLLVRRAGGMLDAGRGQAWREWMSWLPPEVSEAEPWLRYWHGVSLSPVAPLLARKTLVRAADAFGAIDDLPARLIAICAIVDSYDFEWADYRALPGWIDAMEAALAALELDALAPEWDLRIHSRLALALLFVRPDSDRLAPAAQRALGLLAQVDNPAEQLGAGAILLRYFDSVDNAATAGWIVTTLSALADDALLNPFQRVWWYARVARWLNKDGNFHEAREMTGTAKRIVASFDLDPLLFQFLEVHHLLGSGDLAAAGALLAQIRRAVSPVRVRDLVELGTLEAHWHSLSGDTERALQCALEAIRASADAGLPTSERPRLEIFLAACCAMAGERSACAHWCAQAGAHAHGHDLALTTEACQFIAAYDHGLHHEHAHAGAQLRAAFAAHRRRQSTSLFPMQPQFAAALAAQALADGVEPEHVCALIVGQRLNAPRRAIPNWPWPVAVFTFGELRLALDGTVASPSGKAQQRPLLLLKALIAAGDGGKTQQSLAAHLWPDGDDAKSALNVTVHRLRKLLTRDEALVVGAGKVALSKTLVWSDAAALSELCDAIDALPADAPAVAVNRAAADLLQLYRGPFCDGDDDAMILAARDRWRHRFLGAAGELGRRLEAMQEWAGARQLYVRALESEPLAEASHRGLMRCAHALGDPTAAFSAYRRCRETLSIVLGHQPSAETEKLAVTLGLK